MTNKMDNVLFTFLRDLSCCMEKPDCNKCMIKEGCWWFLKVSRVLDNMNDFFSMEWIK